MSAADLRAAIDAAYASIPADPALAVQAAVRARLLSTPSVAAIFPAKSIVEGPRHPGVFPSITFGAPQTVARDLTFERRHATVFLDLHVWTQGEGTVSAQKLAGIVRAALFASPIIVPEIDVADFRFAGTRLVRDPTGADTHAVVSLEALAGWRE